MTQEVEKEIVLGNKQLISLFFVVVALCGVFFALGYMMGGNKSKPATANLDTTATTAAASNISPAPAPAVTPPPESEPPRETVPDEGADVTPAPSDTAAAPPESAVQTKPAQDTPPAAAEAEGKWLQVTALERADADKLVKTLREQNFPAVVANSSKPDLFRVLVGPYQKTTDVADAKSKLKALGFANAFVQK